MKYLALQAIQWPVGPRGGDGAMKCVSKTFPKLYCENDLHYPTFSRPIYKLFGSFTPPRGLKKCQGLPKTEKLLVQGLDEDTTQFLRLLESERCKGAIDAVASRQQLNAYKLAHNLALQTQLFGFPRVGNAALRRRDIMIDIDFFIAPDYGVFLKRKYLERLPAVGVHAVSLVDRTGERGEEWCEIEVLEGAYCQRAGDTYARTCSTCGELCTPFHFDGQDTVVVFSDAPFIRCFGSGLIFVSERFYSQFALDLKCDPGISVFAFEGDLI